MGSPSSHRWSSLEVSLRQYFAPSLSRLHELHPQRLVRTHKMIVRAPPLQMSEQVRRLLCRRPGATSQRRYPMADGQIHPLDESGVQPSREA